MSNVVRLAQEEIRDVRITPGFNESKCAVEFQLTFAFADGSQFAPNAVLSHSEFVKMLRSVVHAAVEAVDILEAE